jgi:hypothetical protein
MPLLNYASTEKGFPMSPRNWFGVGVRLIGLWQIVTGVDELVAYANVVLRLSKTSATNANSFLTHAIIRLLVGFVLMFSAVSIVNAVYPVTPEIRDRAEEPPVVD